MDQEESLFDIGRPAKYLQPRSGAVTGYLIHDNFVPFSTSIARREILLKEAGFDETLKMGIDWELWLRVSLRAHFAYVDEPLILYRMGHPGQMSRNQQERQRAADRIMDRFRRDHPEALSCRTVRSAMSYTHVNRGDALLGVDPTAALRRYFLSILNRYCEMRAYLGLLRICFRLCKSIFAPLKDHAFIPSKKPH